MAEINGSGTDADRRLLAAAQARLPAMIADLEALVRCESPTSDPDRLRDSADLVDRIGTRLLGRPAERIVVDGFPHLRWRLGSGGRPALLLGHHDTVWPVGTLARLPWRVEAGPDGRVARGPGCFDMKAGLVQLFHAVALLPEPAPVTIMITADEETGSATSRPLIEAAARDAVAAFVLEAAGPGGAVKTARRGVSNYRVEVAGRAAHAGLEPERGVNAGVELARQLLRIVEFAEPSASVTPTVLSAGTTTNTVPAGAELMVDVRADDAAAQQRIHERFAALTPVHPGATVRVHGGISRPPLARTMAAGWYDTARELAGRLGLPPLAEVAVGGGSDGNFTAAVGTPTLDGLGAVGGGAHADDEHVLLDQLAPRTALLAGLILAAGRPAQSAS
ncbi:M20/M25/M40 family metallo-hydrolase [Microlunatus sp. GCM10028923]|uniref:M20/M25/M40 family metallo-hydrolase n=1 Tax=Microlunatus sp. GCM10028923 TaxID=3273400 RepID=UPI00361247F2